MSVVEADATLAEMKLQPRTPRMDPDKYLSESLEKLETTFKNRIVPNGTPEQILEFVLDKKGYDSMMKSSVPQFGSKGVDAVKFHYEGLDPAGGPRNIGVPPSQLDLFNSLIKEIK